MKSERKKETSNFPSSEAAIKYTRISFPSAAAKGTQADGHETMLIDSIVQKIEGLPHWLLATSYCIVISAITAIMSTHRRASIMSKRKDFQNHNPVLPEREILLFECFCCSCRRACSWSTLPSFPVRELILWFQTASSVSIPSNRLLCYAKTLQWRFNSLPLLIRDAFPLEA